jgi:hypothetical protein
MSLINVDKVDPNTGTTLELGTSGDTINIPSGVTIANSGTATGFGAVLTGSTNNTVTTVTAANAISGEANLQFDGTDLTVSTGNVIMGTSGKGIDFSATSDGAGTATSELFDDYEEGTWTPTFGNYSGTPTISGARYTKIGRMVYAGLQIQTDATADGSNVQIDGLPYTNMNSVNGACGAGIVAYTTGNAAQRWRGGNNEARFYVYDNTGGNLNYNDLGASKIFELNFIFEAKE